MWAQARHVGLVGFSWFGHRRREPALPSGTPTPVPSSSAFFLCGRSPERRERTVLSTDWLRCRRSRWESIEWSNCAKKLAPPCSCVQQPLLYLFFFSDLNDESNSCREFRVLDPRRDNDACVRAPSIGTRISTLFVRDVAFSEVSEFWPPQRSFIANANLPHTK